MVIMMHAAHFSNDGVVVDDDDNNNNKGFLRFSTSWLSRFCVCLLMVLRFRTSLCEGCCLHLQ